MTAPSELHPTRCPRCGRMSVLTWGELSEEQRMFAERLVTRQELHCAKKGQHRFCTRCWYESNESSTVV